MRSAFINIENYDGRNGFGKDERRMILDFLKASTWLGAGFTPQRNNFSIQKH